MFRQKSTNLQISDAEMAKILFHFKWSKKIDRTILNN